MLGTPPCILLDEPTAGMDPEARRRVWTRIKKAQESGDSGVLLTTHSMEEAEALATKMGIMVKGGILKCIGSSHYIRHKYGTGYTLELKFRSLSESSLLLKAH